jgi:preprotein translocase subunit SecE
MSKFVTYIENAYDELIHKVTWPTWKEIQETTAIVLAAIIFLTLIIAGMDALISAIFKLLYGI